MFNLLKKAGEAAPDPAMDPEEQHASSAINPETLLPTASPVPSVERPEVLLARGLGYTQPAGAVGSATTTLVAFRAIGVPGNSNIIPVRAVLRGDVQFVWSALPFWGGALWCQNGAYATGLLALAAKHRRNPHHALGQFLTDGVVSPGIVLVTNPRMLVGAPERYREPLLRDALEILEGRQIVRDPFMGSLAVDGSVLPGNTPAAPALPVLETTDGKKLPIGPQLAGWCAGEWFGWSRFQPDTATDHIILNHREVAEGVIHLPGPTAAFWAGAPEDIMGEGVHGVLVGNEVDRAWRPYFD